MHLIHQRLSFGDSNPNMFGIVRRIPGIHVKTIRNNMFYGYGLSRFVGLGFYQIFEDAALRQKPSYKKLVSTSFL